MLSLSFLITIPLLIPNSISDIIPLAKKLKECGVFGVSSEEYLQYAEANRKEWAAKGKEIVQEYLVEFEADYKSSLMAMDSRWNRKHVKRPSSFCSLSSDSSFD